MIDDEEPTVYTAGAIVTVTVMLERRDMAVLFGDPNAPDCTEDDEEARADDAEEGDEDKKDDTNQVRS